MAHSVLKWRRCGWKKNTFIFVWLESAEFIEIYVGLKHLPRFWLASTAVSAISEYFFFRCVFACFDQYCGMYHFASKKKMGIHTISFTPWLSGNYHFSEKKLPLFFQLFLHLIFKLVHHTHKKLRGFHSDNFHHVHGVYMWSPTTVHNFAPSSATYVIPKDT